MSQSDGLVKITTRIRAADRDLLQSEFTENGYQWAMRQIVARYCDRLRERNNIATHSLRHVDVDVDLEPTDA